MAVAEKLIQSLEKKIADLIELSNELNRENRSLSCFLPHTTLISKCEIFVQRAKSLALSV